MLHVHVIVDDKVWFTVGGGGGRQVLTGGPTLPIAPEDWPGMPWNTHTQEHTLLQRAERWEGRKSTEYGRNKTNTGIDFWKQSCTCTCTVSVNVWSSHAEINLNIPVLIGNWKEKMLHNIGWKLFFYLAQGFIFLQVVYFPELTCSIQVFCRKLHTTYTLEESRQGPSTDVRSHFKTRKYICTHPRDVTHTYGQSHWSLVSGGALVTLQETWWRHKRKQKHSTAKRVRQLRIVFWDRTYSSLP